MYQKCPICNGTGVTLEPTPNPLAKISYPCPTCKGNRIISEVTGLPPNYPLEINQDFDLKYIQDIIKMNGNFLKDFTKQSDKELTDKLFEITKKVHQEDSENRDSSKYAKHTPTSTKIRHLNIAIEVLQEQLSDVRKGKPNSFIVLDEINIGRIIETLTLKKDGLLQTKDTD